MAYDSLKSEIRQYIKTNGQNEITGQILQNILIDMVNQYPSLNGYATQQWVLNQNYVTSAILSNYLPLSAGQNNALTGDLYVGANSIHLDYNTTAGSAYSNISHEKIVVGSTVNIINGEFTATINNDGTIRLHSVQEVLDERTERVTILKPGEITVGGQVIGASFYKIGGTSSQFLKADGSVDDSTYLTSLAVAGLSDVVLTNLTNGQALVYDSATSKWVNTTIQGGGGGTVTSIATGTGLTGGTITTSGTISVDETFRIRMYSENSYIAARFYNNNNTQDTGRAAIASDNGYIEWWQNNKWMNHAVGHIIFNDTSNQIWASGNKKYSLPSTSGTLALESSLSNYLPMNGGGTIYDDNTYYTLGVFSNTLLFKYNNITYGSLTLTFDENGPHFDASSNLTIDGNAIIHSGNISTQSVSYATSAGNADTVDNYHASDFIKTSATEQSITSTIGSLDMGVINLYRTNGGWSMIGFDGYNTGASAGRQRWGYLGFNAQNSPCYATSSQQLYPLLHEGNYSSYALPLTGGKIHDSSSDYELGISVNSLNFKYNGSTYGTISLSYGVDGAVFSASSNFTINGNAIWHAGNFTPSNYLPLSAGSTKALTGDLYVGGNKIQLDGSSVSMFYLDKTKLLLDDVVSSYYAMELTKSSLEFRYRPTAQVAYKTTTITPSSITSPSFVKTGGTSSQFLKADGSVDSNTYALSSSLSSYLPLSGGTLSNANFGTQLTINRDGGLGLSSCIAYSNNTGILGYIGFDQNPSGTTVTPVWYDASMAKYTLIHSGNIASYLGSNLVTSVCGYNGAVSKAELEQGLGLSSYVKPSVVEALADGVMIVYDSGGWVTTARSTFLGGYLPLSAGSTKALTGTLYTRDINVASGYGITITSGGIGIGTAPATGYAIDADGSIRATGIYVGSYAVRTTNDTYISGNTIYVGSNSLTVSSGGSGTVTSVATGTGLTGGTITTSGTISVDETFRIRMYSENSYIAARFYNNNNTQDTGRAAIASDNGYIEWWQNNKWMNHAVGHIIFNDTSNQIWASGNKKYSLPSTSGTLALESSLSNYLPMNGGGTIYDDNTYYTLGVFSNTLLFKYNNITYGSLTLTFDENGPHFDASSNLTIDGNAIIHSGNISTQSVSYATSAGNADTVDNYHASDFIKTSATEQSITSTIGSLDMGVINLYRTNGGWSMIGFDGYNTGASAGRQRWGYLGFNAQNSPCYATSSQQLYPLLHEGNYSSYALPLTGGKIHDSSSDYELGISVNSLNFKYNGSTYGTISLSYGVDGAVFSASSNFTINGNAIWHAGNFTPSNYLPLSAGSTKALTGDLYVGGNKIQLDGSSVSMFYLDKTKLLLDDVVSSYYAMELTKSSLEFRYRPTAQVAYKTTTITPSSITSPSFVKTGGTSSQFLKADGSVDSNTYALSSSLSSYLPLSGGTLSNANFGTQLTINRDGGLGLSSCIAYSNNTGILGYIGFDQNPSGTTVTPVWYDASMAKYTLIHSGNIASYLGSNLVTSVCGYNGAVSKAELEQGLGLSSYVKPSVVEALADGVMIVYDSGGWVTTARSTFLGGYLPLSAGSTKALTGTLYTRDINVASGYGITITSGGIGIGTAPATGYAIDADGSIRATGIYVGSYAVRTTNDTYISGNTIYVGSNSLTVSSGGSGTVTSVATGTGLTGGTITTSGTISISSTYQTYISHGESAYNSLSDYMPASGLSNIKFRNSTTNPFVNLYASGNWYVQSMSDGIYMGSTSSYSLKVDSSGNASAMSWTNRSDIRHKNILYYFAEPNMEAVANAPAIRFTWKNNNDNNKEHLGSIAQYWKSILPEAVVEDKDGYLFMQYDVIALLSAISVAKRVTEHERRIEALERENAMLRLELNQIKSAA